MITQRLHWKSAHGSPRAALLAVVAALAAFGGAGPSAGAAPYGAPPSTTPMTFTQAQAPWLGDAAVELVTNGGFESGLTGWTIADQLGGSGTWFVGANVAGPLSGIPLAAPAQGANQAFSDQTGPGSHILYQDVTIPASSTAALNLVLWMNNSNGAFWTGPTLDFTVSPNQQFRIDIMNPLAAVNDVGAGVLMAVYQTRPGDPPVLPYTSVSADLSAFAGQMVRLRFAETDNQFYFNVGLDAVSIKAETVVPATNATWGGVKDRYR